MLDGLVEDVKNKIESRDIDGAVRTIKRFRADNDIGVRFNHFANTIISCTGYGKCISDIRKL